jgi:hypothetical protein
LYEWLASARPAFPHISIIPFKKALVAFMINISSGKLMVNQQMLALAELNQLHCLNAGNTRL